MRSSSSFVDEQWETNLALVGEGSVAAAFTALNAAFEPLDSSRNQIVNLRLAPKKSKHIVGCPTIMQDRMQTLSSIRTAATLPGDSGGAALHSKPFAPRLPLSDMSGGAYIPLGGFQSAAAPFAGSTVAPGGGYSTQQMQQPQPPLPPQQLWQQHPTVASGRDSTREWAEPSSPATAPWVTPEKTDAQAEADLLALLMGDDKLDDDEEEDELLKMLQGGGDDGGESAQWSSKQSQAGLSNRTGQNNCFLNVVVQALFHLPKFSSPFGSLSIATETAENRCQRQLFQALQSTFSALSTSSGSLVSKAASGDHLRHALAEAFSEFSLGEMSDAAEALDHVLEALQSVFKVDMIRTRSDRIVARGKCLVHECFEWRLRNFAECATCRFKQREEYSEYFKSEYINVFQLKCVWLDSVLFVVFDPLTPPPPPLTTTTRSAAHARMSSKPFDELCGIMGRDTIPKCDKCWKDRRQAKVVEIKRELIASEKPGVPRRPDSSVLPDVVTLCLVWADPNPSSEQIGNLLRSIDPWIYPHALFDTPRGSPEARANRCAKLCGMVRLSPPPPPLCLSLSPRMRAKPD